MAARLNPKQDARTRERIQTTQLIKRLQDNAFGNVTMTPEQIRCAEILLRKALPDLSAVEHSGDVAQPFAVLPAVAPDSETWEKAFRATQKTKDASKPH